jgi:hypothetical protein
MGGGCMNTSMRFFLFTCLVHMAIVSLMLLLLWFEIVPTQSERDAQSIVHAGVVLQEGNGSATVERKEPKRIKHDRAESLQMASFSG